MQRKNAPETQFSLVNDTSAAQKRSGNQMQIWKRSGNQMQRKIAAGGGEMCVPTPFACLLLFVVSLREKPKTGSAGKHFREKTIKE